MVNRSIFPQQFATLLGLVSAGLWSIASLCNYVTSNIPAFEMLTVICFTSALFAKAINPANQKTTSVQINWPITILCSLLFFFNEGFYIIALKSAPAAHVDIINAFWPILVVLFSALFGDKIQLRYWFGLAIGFSTSLLLLHDHSATNTISGHYSWFGYFFAAIGTIAASLYTITVRLRPQTNILQMVNINSAVCGTIALIAHCLFEVSVIPNFYQVCTLIFMGITTYCIAYSFWNFGVTRGNYKLLCVAIYMSPVASITLLCLFGIATASIQLYAAVILICVASALCSLPEEQSVTGVSACQSSL